MAKKSTKRRTPAIARMFKKPEEPSEEEIKTEKQSKNPLIQQDSLNPEKGIKRHKLIMQSMQSGVERYYFWIIRYMKTPGAYGQDLTLIKLRDLYTAGETSSYWGAVEQRKGLQQEKVSQYLATIGKMTKDMFQIIRELRIIDERLDYYAKSLSGDKSAEIALKSIWTDMVEGGAKNPSSVYGLAREVGFVTLPDLFYEVSPKKGSKGIKSSVDSLKEQGINRKVREVLARKLFQYYTWKEKTHKEISTRKNFILKYLRQHYNVVKTYINWLRPYLHNIRRLQMEQKPEDVDIIAAFETSKVELEVLGYARTYDVETRTGIKTKEYKKYFPCVLVKFNYVALPQMAYQQEYQRGAIHLGRTEITIEPYVVTQEQIEEYKLKKDEEDLELVSSLNASLDALKEELMKYLEEAGEIIKKEEKEKSKKKTGFNPFRDIPLAFRDLFSFAIPARKEKKEVTGSEAAEELSAAKKKAPNIAWRVYDTFKKGHKLYAP